MRAAKLCSLVALLSIFCTGCLHKKATPPAQAQAPPLQTGKGTLNPPQTEPQEKTTSPLASPLPPPSTQSVPLPPPVPKKVRHRVKTPPPKPPETTQAPAATPSSTQPAASGSQTTAQAATPQTAGGDHVGAVSPIGQLTTGDSAMEEKTKHATVDLIAETEQGLAGIKRSLSNEEKVTAAQIRTFLKQAQQALENGDTDGARGLATKAKQLLDELTKP